MKKLSIYALLTVIYGMSLIGCSGSGGSSDAQVSDRSQIVGQTCTPASGARGDRITCAGMQSAEPCNIIFDTQLVPRNTITFSSTGNSFSFYIPPAAPGLYSIKKICGDQQVVLAQETVILRGGSGGTAGGSGGSGGNSQFAECAAGSNQCETGYVCRSNRCVAACNSTYDCPGGQVCRNSQCTDSPRECDDTHMDPTRSCQGRSAINGLVCVHGACEPCRDNSQCGAESTAFQGYVCRVASASGLGSCGECLSNSQCNSGQACVSGRCGSCRQNYECGDGNRCDLSSGRGQCVSSGVSANARANIRVSENLEHMGLLNLSWSIDGIDPASIQDAYIYGPMGVDDCNNIIRTSEDLPATQPNGSACTLQFSNGVSQCLSTDATALRTSSIDTSVTPVGSGATGPATGAASGPGATGVPTGTRPGELPIAMTCRVPLRNQLSGTFYARVRTVPSPFRIVVKTISNQYFTQEVRYLAGSTDLTIDDVIVDHTQPFFTLRGTYSHATASPSFTGCLNGQDLMSTHDGSHFVQKCDFPEDGSLPEVTVTLQGIAGVTVSHDVDFTDCEVNTTLESQGLFASPIGGSAICTPSQLLQGDPTATTCQSTPLGFVGLNATVQRQCHVTSVASPNPVTVPWGLGVMLGQSCLTSSPERFDIDFSLDPSVSITPDGVVHVQKRYSRTPSCYDYTLSVYLTPELEIISYPYTATPHMTVDETPVSSSQRDVWQYDFRISDTESDLNGFCNPNAGISCTYGGEGGDHPMMCSAPLNAAHPAATCVNIPSHDSDDGVTVCHNYRLQHFESVIKTINITSITADCCAYGEGTSEWANWGRPHMGSCTTPLGNGVSYSRTLSIQPFSTDSTHPETVTSLNSFFSTPISGEAFVCTFTGTGSAAGPITVQHTFRRDTGLCDSPDNDGSDPDDSLRRLGLH